MSILDGVFGRRASAPKATLDDHGVAVVDCETTGLHPAANHRIVELAVIQLGRDGVETEWHTLLNPERDLGATDVHGIRGADVIDAPRFRDVVGDVLDLLSGRVVVAHNVRFDQAFLQAELSRAGYDVGPIPGLCTIALSREAGLRVNRLVDCCRALGIDPGRCHRALDDAKACARLFEVLDGILAIRQRPLSELGCGQPPGDWPSGPTLAEPRPRGRAARRAITDDAFLSRLVRERGEVVTSSGDVSAYLEILDRALEDRRLSESEREDLRRAAELYDLSGEDLREAHHCYFDALCTAALADRRITERERYDLELVAGLLGIEHINERLEVAARRASTEAAPMRSESLVGKSVCFTGKLECTLNGRPITREQAEYLARTAGLEVHKSVTKKLDVLVTADPYSNSGKAKKAREYGVRIIAETAFWPLIAVEVD